MRNLILLILFLGYVQLSHSQNWELDFESALKKTQQSEKTLILVFSGSDWCAPCIKLEKDIWTSNIFQKYAEEHFVMLRADFPRKKANKLSKELSEKNAQLAETYNPKGYFPLVVVIDKNKKVLGTTGYKKLDPDAYIAHLNSFIK